MSLINKYNFLRWDDDGSPSTTCEDYVLPVADGDTLKWYINFDNPISDDTTNWQLGVWLPHDEIVLGNIAAISEDDIDGTNFNLYGEWDIGVMPAPWFRLVIYDTGDSNNILYWSNALQYISDTTDTMVIKYRNSFSVLNYEYENLTTFYNQYRIDCVKGEAITHKTKVGYETTSGHFITAKTIYRKNFEFETQFFDEYAHSAFATAMDATDLNFDSVRYSSGEGEYTQETQPRSNVWLGRIRLEQYNYTAVASNT